MAKLDAAIGFCLSFPGPDLYFFGRVGGVGGWLEKGKIKLNSTQVAVEVEVRVELGTKDNREKAYKLKGKIIL